MAQARFSTLLADRRRQLGITLGQAAHDLCMKERILDAFERGDFASIPNNGYAQSMVGSYARYLGLDDQAVIRQFNEDLDVYEHGDSRDRRRSRDEARRSYQDRRAAQQDRYGSQQDASYPAGQSQAYGQRQRSQQGRPYTARNPQQAPRTARRDRTSGARQGSSDLYGSAQRIETRPVEQGYTDDMRYGQTTSPYEAANSAQGRRYSRNIANPQRPNVDRPRRQQRRRSQPQPLLGNQNTVIMLGIIVALVLTLIIVLSVGSCVNHAVGESDDSSSTVPVTTTTSTDSGTSSNSQSSSQGSSSQDSTAASQTKSTTDTSSTSTTTTPEKTEVVVTVSDNSVSWVEITVDGKSMVAESVTGPWTQTYEPTDTMSIQVGDTSAVTVTKNGVTQAFDTKTSGLGTLTIKVPQTTTTTTDGSNAATSSSDGTSTDASTTSKDATADASSSGTGSTSSSTAGTSDTSTSSTTSSSTKTSSKKSTSAAASAGKA